MKWPWVSRRAYDLLYDEVIELRSHVLRVQRREAGMPELPRQPKPEAQAPVAIPDDIEDLVAGFQSEPLRNAIRDQIRIKHADGTPWERIYAEIERQLGPEEDVA